MSKIMFVGLGGVGGYVGGSFANAHDEVTFIARGSRKESIQNNGLHMVSDIKGDIVVRPALVTDDPKEAGIQDVIFVCVKNYSLEQVCNQILPVVDKHTIVLPIMNGVNPGEKIREYLGKGIILDSLIYIVSSAEADYSIRQIDNYARVHVGKDNASDSEKEALQVIKSLFDQAGVECIVEEDINAAIWKKYIFNCAYNVATARFLCNAGDIQCDQEKLKDFDCLLEEAFALGKAKGVNVQEEWIPSHQHRMRVVISPTATSSLKRDMAVGKRSELETFSGYVVKEAEKAGLEVPVSKAYFEALQSM